MRDEVPYSGIFVAGHVTGQTITTPRPVTASVIVIGACAIIDCTPEAVKSLEAAKWA